MKLLSEPFVNSREWPVESLYQEIRSAVTLLSERNATALVHQDERPQLSAMAALGYFLP
jgi:uncharacterized membrane protein